jgi:hypothetical protein
MLSNGDKSKHRLEREQDISLGSADLIAGLRAEAKGQDPSPILSGTLERMRRERSNRPRRLRSPPSDIPFEQQAEISCSGTESD